MDKSLLKSLLWVFISAALVVSAHAQDNEVNPGSGVGAFDTFIPAAPVPATRFETNASLLFLQPGGGNLRYATLISPEPALTPHWHDQAVDPAFSPGFNVGIRSIFRSGGDVQLAWTHLNTYDDASAVTAPPQRLGPSFLIGPPPLFTSASAVAHFVYDAVYSDAGLFLSASDRVQLRAFAGLQGARISQRISTNFQSPGGVVSFTDASDSLFTGAGPRLGTDVHYIAGNFDFLGGIAGSLLIGRMSSHIDFVTASPGTAAAGLTPNKQFLTSPDSTRVVPSLDAKLGGSYAISVGSFGILRCEVGYQAAVYFNAVDHYSLTQVETGADIPFEGTTSVFLRTTQGLQDNFWVHGPYLKVSFQF